MPVTRRRRQEAVLADERLAFGEQRQPSLDDDAEAVLVAMGAHDERVLVRIGQELCGFAALDQASGKQAAGTDRVGRQRIDGGGGMGDALPEEHGLLELAGAGPQLPTMRSLP